MKKTIIESLRLVVIISFLSVGLSIASAASTWTGPAAGVTPPNSNVDAPINVGSSGQSKDGNLLIMNSQGLANGLIVANGNVGIGALTPAEKLEVAGNIKLSGATPTYKIGNVAAPIAASDVATKEYVDARALSCVTISGVRVALGVLGTATCSADYHLTGGGCNASYGYHIDINYPNGQSWNCMATGAVTAYAICCK